MGIVVIGTVPRHNIPVIASIHVSARFAVVEGEVIRACGHLLNAKGILCRTTLELLIIFCADGQHVQIFAGGVLQIVLACGTGFLYAPQERIVVVVRGRGQGSCASYFVGGRLAARHGVKIHVGLVAALAADGIFVTRLQGYGGVFVSQQGIVAILERGICRHVLGYIAIVVDFLGLGVFAGQSRVVGIVRLVQAGFCIAFSVVAAVIRITVEDVLHGGEQAGEQADCSRTAIVGDFRDGAIGSYALQHRCAGADGCHRGIIDGEGIVRGESQQVALSVANDKAHAAGGSAHRHLSVRSSHCVRAVRSRSAFIGLKGAEVGIGIAVPQPSCCLSVVLHVSSPRRIVIDKEYLYILGIFFGFHIGYGSIDVFLRLCVFGRRVVTHIAMVHHFQETVGAEEVRQVFLCCIADLFIEVQERSGAGLIVFYGHRVLTQHLNQSRSESGVVAHQVVVKPQFVVHLRLCPNVVGVKVVSVLAVGVEYVAQIALSLSRAAGSAAVVPYSHVAEEVIRNLRQSAHVERCLVLVADFVGRSPADSARAAFFRHLADNVCQRAVLIVAAVPSAGHIAVIHRDAQTVHAVVFAVIAGIRVFGFIAGVAENVMVCRNAAERRIPGVVACIGFGHLLLA